MELFILLVLVGVAGLAIWKFNKGKGFDVNSDGKVDVADAKAAVKNTVDGVKAAATKTAPAPAAKKPAAKKPAAKKPAAKTTAAKKPAAKKPAAPKKKAPANPK